MKDMQHNAKVVKSLLQGALSMGHLLYLYMDLADLLGERDQLLPMLQLAELAQESKVRKNLQVFPAQEAIPGSFLVHAISKL